MQAFSLFYHEQGSYRRAVASSQSPVPQLPLIPIFFRLIGKSVSQRSPEKVPTLQPLNKAPNKQNVGFCGTSIPCTVLAPDPVIISGLRQQFSFLWSGVGSELFRSLWSGLRSLLLTCLVLNWTLKPNSTQIWKYSTTKSCCISLIHSEPVTTWQKKTLGGLVLAVTQVHSHYEKKWGRDWKSMWKVYLSRNGK